MNRTAGYVAVVLLVVTWAGVLGAIAWALQRTWAP